jgi:suppressor of ftsI
VLIRAAVLVSFVLIQPAATRQVSAQQTSHEAAGHVMPSASGSWRMPPMDSMPAMPGLDSAVPKVRPYLPGTNVNSASIPAAIPSKPVELSDGDTLTLDASLVTRTIRGRKLVMYGFNGQYPGPLIRVREQATIIVRFTNHIEWPTTVHWHGVRLDNPFDGVPGLTQEHVAPGETFVYRVHFRDPGIYWYHPHHREDIQQDLGLYGNMLVAPAEPGYWSTVHREQVLMLDDLLLDDQGLLEYGLESPHFALMGRFGNVLLVNGEPRYRMDAGRGEVVRFFLTNASSTRTFNISFGGAPVKLVAADMSRLEREVMVESVVLAPAERYVVEVRFPEQGDIALTNRVQAINHPLGEFFPVTDTLGIVHVGGEAATPDHAATFATLRQNASVTSEVNPLRSWLQRTPDHEMRLRLQLDSVLPVLGALMQLDTAYFHPVEWTDPMPMMNWLLTGREVQWQVIDPASGRTNDSIHWAFRQGQNYKIRIVNEASGSLHAMQHPMHFHGQRFLVLSRDGVPNDNLAWKDTVLVPVGSTVDILLEASNPGRWMAHCHIAEHLSVGMGFAFSVDGG